MNVSLSPFLVSILTNGCRRERGLLPILPAEPVHFAIPAENSGLPRACSGAMYGAVPRIMPLSVAALAKAGEFTPAAASASPLIGSRAFARSKSSI